MGGKETNKDLLEAQIEWLKKLSHQMDALLSIQKDVKAILTTTEAKQMPPEYCQSLESNVKQLTKEVKTYIENYVEEKNKTTLTDASFKFKKTISREWARLLNTRKIAYYNKIRSEGIASVYASFLQKDPVFIPQKFREKEFPGQSEDQTSLKLDLCKRKMDIEIQRLQEQSVKQDSILTETQRSIEILIKKNQDVKIQQTLKEHWLQATKREEEKSQSIWEKRKEWFEKLPEANAENVQQPENNQQGRLPYTRRPRGGPHFQGQRGYNRQNNNTTRMSYADVARRNNYQNFQGQQYNKPRDHQLNRHRNYTGRQVKTNNNNISVLVHNKTPRQGQWKNRLQWKQQQNPGVNQRYGQPNMNQGRRQPNINQGRRIQSQELNNHHGGRPFLQRGQSNRNRWKRT